MYDKYIFVKLRLTFQRDKVIEQWQINIFILDNLGFIFQGDSGEKEYDNVIIAFMLNQS